ncbi:hypothetical protein WA026_013936 [Henosepilachna vigintioctopunctata]|uniref:Uncharacterized protein n=1 Tax=Henosepilachna vigintioctopunctata TaxID=420089 RepID=A0AAW1U958_9CUCU
MWSIIKSETGKKDVRNVVIRIVANVFNTYLLTERETISKTVQSDTESENKAMYILGETSYIRTQFRNLQAEFEIITIISDLKSTVTTDIFGHSENETEAMWSIIKSETGKKDVRNFVSRIVANVFITYLSTKREIISKNVKSDTESDNKAMQLLEETSYIITQFKNLQAEFEILTIISDLKSTVTTDISGMNMKFIKSIATSIDKPLETVFNNITEYRIISEYIKRMFSNRSQNCENRTHIQER